MTENRFKLKKDGKAVGYERYVYCDQREDYLKGKSLVPQHSKDGNNWEYLYAWELKTSPKGYWFDAQLDIDVYIEHDEKCCFVTKDKNGKDVFAGDTVRSGKRVLTIVWDNCDMQWKAKQPGRTSAAEYYLPNTPLCQWAISEQFELIEDKEDD